MRVSLTSRPVSAFPVIRAGRLPRHTLSRPARRSLALRPAWSLSRPWRPVTSECFRRCRYLHHPLRLLPAGTTVAGRDSHPLKNGAFHGAPDKGGWGVVRWLNRHVGRPGLALVTLFRGCEIVPTATGSPPPTGPPPRCLPAAPCRRRGRAGPGSSRCRPPSASATRNPQGPRRRSGRCGRPPRG